MKPSKYFNGKSAGFPINLLCLSQCGDLNFPGETVMARLLTKHLRLSLDNSTLKSISTVTHSLQGPDESLLTVHVHNIAFINNKDTGVEYIHTQYTCRLHNNMISHLASCSATSIVVLTCTSALPR